MNRLTLISVLLAITTLLFCQQADKLHEIDLRCSAITRSIPRLQKDSLEILDMSTDGGTATAHFDRRGGIRVIALELYGESADSFEHFYFSNDSLIFVKSETHKFNSPYYVDTAKGREIGEKPFDPSKTKVSVDFYYFEAV